MLNAYWEYAGTRYKHKFQAIQASSNDVNSISFHLFDDPSFETYDWSIEPVESLKSLMKVRALQLRDTYPYLKLWFSGGADSTSVLNIFLDNNIFIDEIVVYRFGDDNLSNFEIDTYTLPYLKQIQNSIPNTKITIYNFNEEYYDQYLSDKWFFTKNALSPRHFHIPKIKGKNFCHIFCSLDPEIEVDNDRYYTTFWDTTGADELASYRNVELFYTTPSLPKLHAKQVYLLKKHLVTKDLKSQKYTIRNFLRDKPVAPEPDFLDRTFGGSENHLHVKDKYLFKKFDKRLLEKFRYVLNTKINNTPVMKSTLGFNAYRFELGD